VIGVTITREMWLQAIGDALPPSHEDAITITEFTVLVGRKRTQAKAIMAGLVKAGKAKRVTKQVIDVSGRPYTVPAYLLVKK
jgi:hypothetical protein